MSDTSEASALEVVHDPEDVGRAVEIGILDGRLDTGVCCQVHDRVDAPTGLFCKTSIADVPDEEFHTSRSPLQPEDRSRGTRTPHLELHAFRGTDRPRSGCCRCPAN